MTPEEIEKIINAHDILVGALREIASGKFVTHYSHGNEYRDLCKTGMMNIASFSLKAAEIEV